MFLSNQKTSNPVFSRAFGDSNSSFANISDQPMTINGTINKTALMVLITIASAIFVIQDPVLKSSKALLIGGAVVGFIIALVIVFSPKNAKYLVPIYSVSQGLFLGVVTGLFEQSFPGIAFNAVLLTMFTFVIMLGLYYFRIIKVTEKFKSIILAATLAIASYYFIIFIVSLFSSNFVPFHHGSGMLSIGFSIFVVAIAAFSLLLDFDMIENGVKQGAPKYMEWYSAFGILVTLIWLYVEMLKLLSKLNSRE